MKLFKIVFLLSLLTNLNLAFAHGEDKPGPNSGYIRMPGAYHTEIIQDGKSALKVYILDLQFKNPSTDQNKLEISHSSKVKATCEPKDNYYQCTFPETVDLLKKGNLTVASQLHIPLQERLVRLFLQLNQIWDFNNLFIFCKGFSNS